jgi:hypothetical protein
MIESWEYVTKKCGTEASLQFAVCMASNDILETK